MALASVLRIYWCAQMTRLTCNRIGVFLMMVACEMSQTWVVESKGTFIGSPCMRYRNYLKIYVFVVCSPFLDISVEDFMLDWAGGVRELTIQVDDRCYNLRRKHNV